MSVSLYRFQINLSDIDRARYETLDFRLALHPSESHEYLLTRMLSYVLNVQDGLEFSATGLSDPDTPALSSPDPRGGLALVIEIGNPSARRLHKAAKSATKVKVYTYKNPKPLVDEISGGEVYNSDRIELYSLAPSFLEKLKALLHRDNVWDVIHTEGSLTVNVGEISESTELVRHHLPGGK